MLSATSGLSRDKPVGYLVLLMAATALVANAIRSTAMRRTTLGRHVLEWLRSNHSRAAAAPRNGELLFAFALGGVAVLQGTHLAELGRLFAADSGGGEAEAEVMAAGWRLRRLWRRALIRGSASPPSGFKPTLCSAWPAHAALAQAQDVLDS